MDVAERQESVTNPTSMRACTFSNPIDSHSQSSGTGMDAELEYFRDIGIGTDGDMHRSSLGPIPPHSIFQSRGAQKTGGSYLRVPYQEPRSIEGRELRRRQDRSR